MMQTREAFDAAPLVRKARSQIARLQSVIDYGIGDVRRAREIIDRLEGSLAHAFEHEAPMAVSGNPCSLAGTLYDWFHAIDRVCAEVERESVS